MGGSFHNGVTRSTSVRALTPGRDVLAAGQETRWWRVGDVEGPNLDVIGAAEAAGHDGFRAAGGGRRRPLRPGVKIKQHPAGYHA